MILSLAAAAMTASMGATPPAPAPPDPARDLAVSVSLADIDASRPAAAGTVKRRLRTAAVELCLQATDALTLAEQQTAYSQCVAAATDRALRDADALFARRTVAAATTLALR